MWGQNCSVAESDVLVPDYRSDVNPGVELILWVCVRTSILEPFNEGTWCFIFS